MANTLGTIVVDLQANTAAFIEGMTRASSSAKKAGGEISESFSRLGEFAGSALAPFGEMGRVIGEAFGQIGALGGSAAQSLAKMSGGMSALAVGGGVTVAAIAAIEAAAIGLTIHTAEAAAKMFVMSQVTGVSVEALSGLAFVAKQSGVEASAMENGLTKLNKAIFAAGTAAPGTVNAFTRLHIAVRDSNGEFRDTQDVFRDIAEKFAAMPDGPVKGALAIQLFGRAGAELIPVLNQGKDGIDEFLKTARALGIVLDTETAEAAHKFEQNLNTIKAASDGVSLQLTKALLPALNQVTEALVNGLKDKGSGTSLFIEGIATLVKGTIGVFHTWWTAIEEIGLAFRHAGADVIIFSDQVSAMWAALKSGDFSGISRAYAEAGQKQKDNAHLFNEETKKLWKDNSDFIENTMGPRAPFTLDHPRRDKTGVDTKPVKDDTVLERIKERIAALGREADEWLKIGQAGTQAEQLIAEAQKKGTEEFGKLRDLASKEKDPTRRAQALQFVDSNKGFIESAEATTVYAAAIKGIDSDLDKQRLKLQEEIPAIEAVSTAFQTGGLAAALITAHYADQAAKVDLLRETHNRLGAQFGNENAQVRQLADGLAKESQKLAADEALYAAKVYAELNLEINKATASFANELPALKAVAAAYFDTAEAARAAQVELKVAQFKNANPTADEGQVNRFRELEKQKSDQAFQNSVSEQAAKYDLIHAYEEEIRHLEILREKLIEKHSSTMLIDAEEYDAQRKAIQQWDEAALKVSTYGDKFRAVMNQVILDGQNFGQKLAQSIGKAIDGLSSSLAKFIVTGKGGFKQLFQSLEEEILKASIQKGFSALLGKLFGGGGNAQQGGTGDKGIGGLLGNIPIIGGVLGKLGGLFGLGGGPGKADGSQGNPFYVISAGGAEGGPGGLSGLVSSFGGEGGGDGGGIGGAIGGIGSIFGGFLAAGGDVTPGKAYVVGEKHPEFFVPKQAGQVAPSLKMGGDTVHHTTVNFHVHGVQDVDSFRRSQSQIFGDMHRQMTIAHARNY